jgi:hypothetical protein
MLNNIKFTSFDIHNPGTTGQLHTVQCRVYDGIRSPQNLQRYVMGLPWFKLTNAPRLAINNDVLNMNMNSWSVSSLMYILRYCLGKKGGGLKKLNANPPSKIHKFLNATPD